MGRARTRAVTAKALGAARRSFALLAQLTEDLEVLSHHFCGFLSMSLVEDAWAIVAGVDVENGSEVWRGVADRLAGKRRLHLISIRGFGDLPAGANASGAVMATVAAEVRRYIAEQQLERPAIIGRLHRHDKGHLVLRTAASLARPLAAQVGIIDFDTAIEHPPEHGGGVSMATLLVEKLGAEDARQREVAAARDVLALVASEAPSRGS